MRIIPQLLLSILLLGTATPTSAAGRVVQTLYTEQKVVFDFYLDDPAKIGSALYWVRSWFNPLMDHPYNYAPEFLSAVVVIHGTEIVTVVEKNYANYKEPVDRMKYYASLGVKFKVCALAAEDYGYTSKDFQDFIEVVPSAFAELVHWQLQGYGLITPRILEKKYTVEEIR
jgi:intracellular sulfur oxidation DsrE/DsrF family protein